MIKVAAKHEERSHLLELVGVFRARVVDVAPESLTIEITGAEDKIDGPAGSASPIRIDGSGPHRSGRHAAGRQILPRNFQGSRDRIRRRRKRFIFRVRCSLRASGSTSADAENNGSQVCKRPHAEYSLDADHIAAPTYSGRNEPRFLPGKSVTLGRNSGRSRWRC